MITIEMTIITVTTVANNNNYYCGSVAGQKCVNKVKLGNIQGV